MFGALDAAEIIPGMEVRSSLLTGLKINYDSSLVTESCHEYRATVETGIQSQ